jgi:integrase
MDGKTMRLTYEGLLRERMASGNWRWRVRVEGNPARRISLTVAPDHPEFHEIYLAARAGIKQAPRGVIVGPDRGTVAWLATAYLGHLHAQVAAGQASPYTLKQRAALMPLLLSHKSSTGRSDGRTYASLPAEIPPHELVLFRDSLMATPGKAKNMFKTLKAMYSWAVERGHCATNPAASISVAYTSQGGATAWTLADLARYRERHPPGTMPHLALSLFMFTACRISDACWLGRDNEVTRGGTVWLSWQPRKKGSSPVDLPILPPLLRAIRAQKIVGRAYLLTDHGKPFASPEALRNRFKDWCRQAGLEDRSSHGIRKAAGHLLALHGATQYEITAVHGHANATTSEVYTRGYDRQVMAEKAMGRLDGMEW